MQIGDFPIYVSLDLFHNFARCPGFDRNHSTIEAVLREREWRRPVPHRSGACARLKAWRIPIYRRPEATPVCCAKMSLGWFDTDKMSPGRSHDWGIPRGVARLDRSRLHCPNSLRTKI